MLFDNQPKKINNNNCRTSSKMYLLVDLHRSNVYDQMSTQDSLYNLKLKQLVLQHEYIAYLLQEECQAVLHRNMIHSYLQGLKNLSKLQKIICLLHLSVHEFLAQPRSSISTCKCFMIIKVFQRNTAYTS